MKPETIIKNLLKDRTRLEAKIAPLAKEVDDINKFLKALGYMPEEVKPGAYTPKKD